MFLADWWACLTRRRTTSGPRAVIVYSRPGCHLCHEAEEALARYQRRFGFTMNVVDISGDEALTQAHGESIPVVVIDGVVRFRGRVNEILLRRLMR